MKGSHARSVCGTVYFFFSAILILVSSLAAPATWAAPAILTGDNNKFPNACQGVAGASWLVAWGVAAHTVPVSPTTAAVKFGADAAAYTANLELKYCPPAITAPATVKKHPDAGTCSAGFKQPITEGEYFNVFGIPTSYLFAEAKEALGKTTWGELGRPLVYDFNTSADVRLIDPAKEGAEDDAWEPDEEGNISFPVGRNAVTWRADSKMGILDVIPMFMIPLLAPGDEQVEEAALKKSPPLQEFVTTEFESIPKATGKGQVAKLITRFMPKNLHDVLEILAGEKVHHIAEHVPWLNWRTGYFTGYDKATNADAQEVWVYDTVPPTLQTNTDPNTFPETLKPLLTYDPNNATYFLEAFAPRIPDFTVQTYGKMLLSSHDDCQGTRPPLNPLRIDVPQRQYWVSGDASTLKWQVADDGPNEQGGSNLSNVVDQKFAVRDTNPPALIAPPSKVVETAGAGASVQLGSPRVFDLADLTPSVSNDVNNDPKASPSFNLGINTVTWTATDEAGNKTSKEQLINVKQQGTNTAPVGNNQSVSAVSYKPVDIILKGFDADFDPNSGRHDPLTFTIKDKPANGFFVAPLLPYFIDDYRLEASALRFAGQPEQVDPISYCDNAKNGAWQMKYPYTSQWFSVDDDGTTVVYDQGDMLCGVDGLTIKYRLAAFGANGDLLHHALVDSSQLTDVYIDWHTKGVYTIDNPDPGAPNIVNYYDENLNPLGSFNAEYIDSFGGHTRLTGSAFITADTQGIVYVGKRGSGDNVVVAYQGPTAATEFGTNNSYNFLGILHSDSNMQDIATDSQNNVYISKPDRILKFAASSIDDQGKLVLGAFIGWMGRCDSNLTNTYACDTVNHRSIGFSCTDTLCGFDTINNPNNYGSDPAQFNDARGIAVDPHDILYVSDYGNSRVQRFTPEGDFAGQAVSNGAGYGFILGDFGRPKDITVNSDHFYILNNNLLHVLQTTPVTPIDDSSAKVTYQSDNNFVGTDNFTFNASDGLATGTGTVTVNVERNYRPPVISVPPSYTLNEDGTVNITLVGSDPDGSLDTLSYSIVDQPGHGTLSGGGANLVYTPNANYNGTDSFTYRVSDGVYQSAPAAVALTIASVEDAPQVTAPATDDEGLGYKFQFPVDVFDPDADEALKVTIDWGDGSSDHDGVITDKDGKVMTGDYIQSDGTLPDGLQATGPMLNLGSDGHGTVSFEHAYTVPKDYVAQICVTDRVQTLSDGTKQATADSKKSCAQTTITVRLITDLQLYLAPDSDHADPGTTDPFTITVTNRPFDVDVPGFTKGLDAANVTVTGKNGSGLTMTQTAPSQGSCSLDQGTFNCSLGGLAAGASTTIKVTTAIDSLAPGNALLTLNANRQADSVDALENDAIGVIKINASGKPPIAQSLSVAAGPTAGGTALTVTGHDFDADAAVLFDNLPAADIEVVDANTITLTTPAHVEDKVDVVVVNSDDQAATLAKAFQFSNAAPVSSGGNPAAGGGNSGGGGGGGLDVTSITLLSLFSTLAWIRRRRLMRGV